VPERQYLEETGQVDDQDNATTSRIETGGRMATHEVDGVTV
jgi:hypothetical protein